MERGRLEPPAWLGLVARLALGAVLAYSGTHKAAAPAEEFAVVIENYRILPEDAVPAAARVLPWVEVIMGFALIAGYLTRGAAAAAGGLLIAFMAALASTKIRGFDLPNCGCFGSEVHLTQIQALLLDSGLLVMAFLAFKKGNASPSLDRWAEEVR